MMGGGGEEDASARGGGWPRGEEGGGATRLQSGTLSPPTGVRFRSREPVRHDERVVRHHGRSRSDPGFRIGNAH